MSKKLTAKQLLREVQSIKKQASSGFFKPAPIEYETESDLNISIDSALLDIVDGFGFLGAKDVVVKGNTAYVKVEGEVELDVIRLYKVVSPETKTYLEETTSKINRNFDSSWAYLPGVEYLFNQAASLSKNWNERAYIKLTQDYVEFKPSGEPLDIDAPDSIYEALGDRIYLSDKMYDNWPTVTKKLPRGIRKEDLPKIIMEGLKEYTSKARKYSQKLDDPKYWVQY